jgi:hypothetical protein
MLELKLLQAVQFMGFQAATLAQQFCDGICDVVRATLDKDACHSMASIRSQRYLSISSSRPRYRSFFDDKLFTTHLNRVAPFRNSSNGLFSTIKSPAAWLLNFRIRLADLEAQFIREYNCQLPSSLLGNLRRHEYSSWKYIHLFCSIF